MSVKDKAAAIDRFVRTIKASGVYDDIGTACIMAGWTNLAGALYPLKGAAPTNGGGLFQDADLDPGIGLKGDGSSKYLNSNRANNADGQDDNHNAFYLSVPPVTDGRHFMGSNAYGVSGANTTFGNLGVLGVANRSNTALVTASGQDAVAGFKGTARAESGSFSYRTGDLTTTSSQASFTPTSQDVFVFCRNDASVGATLFSDATLSWYSIGSATDLAALDSAVSTLMADLRAIDEAGFDRDAVRYIRNVEAADGSYLETGVKQAINAFVVGCKKDGIWDAIKASCILCGARTISGALVPLVGDAPTAYSFASGDYDRETGLVGNGTTKYLDSNRNNNADPQNDQHMAAYATAVTNGTTIGVGALQEGITRIGRRNPSGFTNTLVFRSQTNAGVTDKTDAQWASGFAGVSRNQASSCVARSAGTNLSVTADSQVPYSQNSYVFCRNVEGAADDFAASGLRLAFYSIGSSLSLSALDNRVSTLVAAIAAAIP